MSNIDKSVEKEIYIIKLVEKEINEFTDEYNQIMTGNRKRSSDFGLKKNIQSTPYIGLKLEGEKMYIEGKNPKADINEEYFKLSEDEQKNIISEALINWGKNKVNKNLLQRIFETIKHYDPENLKPIPGDIRRRMYTYQKNGYINEINDIF
jgi:hypothetical protein